MNRKSTWLIAVLLGAMAAIGMIVAGWLAWQRAIPLFGDAYEYVEAAVLHIGLAMIDIWAIALVAMKIRNASMARHDLTTLNRRMGGAIAMECSTQIAFIALALGAISLQIPVLQFVRATVLADCLQVTLFVGLAVMYYLAVP